MESRNKSSCVSPSFSPEIIYLNSTQAVLTEMIRKKKEGRELASDRKLLFSFEGITDAAGRDVTYVASGGGELDLFSQLIRYDGLADDHAVEVKYVIGRELQKIGAFEEFDVLPEEDRSLYFFALQICMLECETLFAKNQLINLRIENIISSEQVKAGTEQYESILKDPLFQYQVLFEARQKDNNFSFPLFAAAFADILSQLKSNSGYLNKAVQSAKRLANCVNSIRSLADRGFPYAESFKVLSEIIQEYIVLSPNFKFTEWRFEVENNKVNMARLCETDDFYFPLKGDFAYHVMNRLRCVPLRPIGVILADVFKYDQYALARDPQHSLGLFTHDFGHARLCHDADVNWLITHPEFLNDKLKAYAIWDANYAIIENYINENFHDKRSFELAHSVITYLTHETFDGEPCPYDFKLLSARLNALTYSRTSFRLFDDGQKGLFTNYLRTELSFNPTHEEVLRVCDGLKSLFAMQLKPAQVNIHRLSLGD